MDTQCILNCPLLNPSYFSNSALPPSRSVHFSIHFPLQPCRISIVPWVISSSPTRRKPAVLARSRAVVPSPRDHLAEEEEDSSSRNREEHRRRLQVADNRTEMDSRRRPDSRSAQAHTHICTGEKQEYTEKDAHLCDGLKNETISKWGC